MPDGPTVHTDIMTTNTNTLEKKVMKIFNANVLLGLAILLGCVFFFFFKGNGSHRTEGGRLLKDSGIDNTELTLTDHGTMINGRALELQAQLDTLAAEEVQANGKDSATIQEQVQDELIATLTSWNVFG